MRLEIQEIYQAEHNEARASFGEEVEQLYEIISSMGEQMRKLRLQKEESDAMYMMLSNQMEEEQNKQK